MMVRFPKECDRTSNEEKTMANKKDNSQWAQFELDCEEWVGFWQMTHCWVLQPREREGGGVGGE